MRAFLVCLLTSADHLPKVSGRIDKKLCGFFGAPAYLDLITDYNTPFCETDTMRASKALQS